MHPVIFQTDFFGLLDEPWTLHAYGLLIAFGFMSAMLLAKRQAEREGEAPEEVIDVLGDDWGNRFNQMGHATCDLVFDP